jgi:hypothetical protein
MVAPLTIAFVGAVVALIGYRTRGAGGRYLLPCGAALIVGPLSPLTEGSLSPATRTVFSTLAILLALSGAILALLDGRRRRVLRGGSRRIETDRTRYSPGGKL